MPPELFSLFESCHVGHSVNTAKGKSAESCDSRNSLFFKEDLEAAYDSISTWPGYRSTPLRSLDGLACELGVAAIHYKDEGSRFGLGSFKALGGAYAVQCLAAKTSADATTLTIASATDGNHGLSVAWGAKSQGCQCIIYIHAEVSAGREQALKAKGAKVIRIDGNYDDSVRRCYADAEENGWTVVSDTSSDNAGDAVAKTVMAGYSVMVAEIVEQLADNVPTHVFVQGGVGGLAATVCEYFRLAWGAAAPHFVIVEPEFAPCLFESARKGERTPVAVNEETVMAGLSCGEVSNVAWPTLSQYADDFLTIPDTTVAPTMRLLAKSPFGDLPIIAGESAVAGLAGMICTARQTSLRSALRIDDNSRILVVGTEGATDPTLYESLTGHSVESVRRDNI